MRTNLVKKKDTKSPLNDSMLDMVIAFDTTGSMCAYIEAVKETGERYVNINTISHLIYNGVKYVVE